MLKMQPLDRPASFGRANHTLTLTSTLTQTCGDNANQLVPWLSKLVLFRTEEPFRFWLRKNISKKEKRKSWAAAPTFICQWPNNVVSRQSLLQFVPIHLADISRFGCSGGKWLPAVFSQMMPPALPPLFASSCGHNYHYIILRSPSLLVQNLTTHKLITIVNRRIFFLLF